jgi:hypothetical protein
MKQRIRWAASLVFVLASLLFSSSQTHSQRPNVEQRVNSLLAQMTLEEKLGQLQQLDGEANGNFRPEHLELIRGFWNREMRHVVEPGEFRVMVGANSVDIIETKFQVN